MIFEDSGDAPQLLRKVSGAHGFDLCCVRYSFHLSLVVTGSVSGELAVWDYESS